MTNYDELTRMLDALIETEGSAKSKWMNVPAIMMETTPDLSWVGFYLVGDSSSTPFRDALRA